MRFAAVKRPQVAAQRAKAVAYIAEQILPLLLFLGGQLARGHEVVAAGERSDERRERRAVILVAALGQDLQQGRAAGKAGAAKAARPYSGGSDDEFFRLRDLSLKLGAGQLVQPLQVVLRVVADFVTLGGDLAEQLPVRLCVAPDEEHGGLEPLRGEGLQRKRKYFSQI